MFASKGLIRIERMKEGVGVPKDGGLIGPGNEQSTQTFPGHGKGGDPDAVEGGTGGEELFQSLWTFSRFRSSMFKLQNSRTLQGWSSHTGWCHPSAFARGLADDTLPRSAGLERSASTPSGT